MVLPLSDEDKPKCFLCHELQKNYEELRKHQEDKHPDFFEFHEKSKDASRHQAMSLFFRF